MERFVTLSSSYEDKIKKVFPNVYVQREKNRYEGPVWFKYAIFTGDSKHCKNTLLGLGVNEEKAWLDAFYGFKFLKVHLGMEKKLDVVTSSTLTRENYEQKHPIKENSPEESVVVDYSESGYKNESIITQFKEAIQTISEGKEITEITEIRMGISVIQLRCCLVKIDNAIQCDGFIRHKKDWIQCANTSSLRGWLLKLMLEK